MIFHVVVSAYRFAKLSLFLLASKKKAIIVSVKDPAFTGSTFVCSPLHHHVLLSSILGAVGLFRSDMLLIFNMVWPWFSCGTVCLSADTLSRQRHDILDFSNCPLSPVLHVTLANWQGFGFEFHLRSSPSWWVYGYQSTSWIFHSLLHRADETQQGRNSCPRLQLLAFSLDSIMSLPR